MSALAEALLAAQRQAVGALLKAYIAKDEYGPEWLCQNLDRIGCTDEVDQGRLLGSLNILRALGVQDTNGATPKPSPETEPASQKQLDYLAKLADEKHTMPPDGPLTKAKASEAISALQAGTYNPDDYCAPF